MVFNTSLHAYSFQLVTPYLVIHFCAARLVSVLMC
jgi:hypothetical protein